MGNNLKKFLCAIIALAVSATALFSGCTLGFGGNSIDVTVNNSYDSMTDEQWREYKEILIGQDTDSGSALQTAINGSLLSGVSILTRFAYSDINGYIDYGFGREQSVGKQPYHAVFCGAGVIVELDKNSGDAYVITNCHVVYDDSSKEIISDDVRLYLYGQDTEGVNYNLNYNYVKYGNRKVYFKENGEEYYLLDYEVTDDEDYCIKAEVVCASSAYDIALLKVSNSEVLKKAEL